MDANRADQKLPPGVGVDDLDVRSRSDIHNGEWVVSYQGRTVTQAADLYTIMTWLFDFRRFRERTP